MIRLLPFAIEAVLLVFCLVDCVLADESRVRRLPKWGWVALIVLVPLIGCIAWLVAGRPPGPLLGRGTRAPRPTGGPQWERPPYLRPAAPDDDPEFLAKLKRDAEHERLLKQWEDDLRRREDDLRQGDGATDPEPRPDDR